uniref:Uncharacterized protein n=1 Tax=Aegilops tauschii subsp. strangulata TaxID=200361 RepID=A0A453K8C2_AEGTS
RQPLPPPRKTPSHSPAPQPPSTPTRSIGGTFCSQSRGIAPESPTAEAHTEFLLLLLVCRCRRLPPKDACYEARFSRTFSADPVCCSWTGAVIRKGRDPFCWLLQFLIHIHLSMHRVGSAGNTAGSSRPRKEKRFTYVLNDADNKKHCAGINCLSYLNASASGTSDYLFTGSRDGTLKRWEYQNGDANFSATFESHVDWVNDAIIVGQNLVSCSSDTTLKVWNCLADGACTKTLRQHSDYVICLAAAEKNSNIVASGGLGGEVFIWDLDAAIAPIAKSVDAKEDEVPNGNSGPALSTLCNVNSSGNIVSTNGKSHGYSPIAAKGHKDSVYALDMNDTGTLLVSGGTEKVVRVWDPRTGSKNMKLRGHTDNIRALLIDSTGRYCLSGSSDSMIRLWDLGQQRCVHSYAVHTDSVWALASTPSFGHVYSGGRDQSVYLTDLSTRESVLLCTNEHPILQLSLQDDTIWVATTDSSVYGWPAEGQTPQKVFQKGGSFLAGNLSFSRARASLEGSAPVPVYKEPSFTIPGVPAIVQHEIMNNRRHVLTKDTVGSVKLWEITRGAVIEDFGKGFV